MPLKAKSIGLDNIGAWIDLAATELTQTWWSPFWQLLDFKTTTSLNPYKYKDSQWAIGSLDAVDSLHEYNQLWYYQVRNTNIH